MYCSKLEYIKNRLNVYKLLNALAISWCLNIFEVIDIILITAALHGVYKWVHEIERCTSGFDIIYRNTIFA